MAGDLEDCLADAVAGAAVRLARASGGLAKSGAGPLWKSARKAAREVAGELVTPCMVRVASLTERLEWLEEQQAARDAAGGDTRG